MRPFRLAEDVLCNCTTRLFVCSPAVCFSGLVHSRFPLRATMANRWSRNGKSPWLCEFFVILMCFSPSNSLNGILAPYGGGYVGSGGVGVGFYMTSASPADRRPYNNTPVSKPFYGGYRDDYRPRSERREEFRGGKRGPPKGRSPVEKRYHDTPPSQRRDHRPFGKRPPPLGKYDVKLPKTVFNVVTKSVAELRHTYPRLNISSDVYECESSWCRAFPLHSPFKLGSGSDYHVSLLQKRSHLT